MTEHLLGGGPGSGAWGRSGLALAEACDYP